MGIRSGTARPRGSRSALDHRTDQTAFALALNARSPLFGLRWAVSGLLPHGRLAEADIPRALDLDPMSLFTRVWLACVLWLARQFDRSDAQARTVLDQDPHHALGHFMMSQAYSQAGAAADAGPWFRQASELSGGAPIMTGWLGGALALSGHAEEARGLLAQRRLDPRRARLGAHGGVRRAHPAARR